VHLPDHHPEESPTFVSAKVKNREKEKLLALAAELPIPNEAPRIDAIGIPLEERPGVSEPAHVPAGVSAQGPEIDGPSCCTARDDDERLPVWANAPHRLLRGMEENVEVAVPVSVLLLAIGI
jgi:hypothetical protein